MKNKTRLILLSSGMGLLVLIYACKKSFLEVQPLGSLNPTVLANKTGVDGLLIGAYHVLGGSANWGSAPSNWSFGSMAADEAYKGSTPSDQSAEGLLAIAIWSVPANDGYLNEKWRANYDGIQRANEVLRVMALAKDISANDQKRIAGEARFLRGHFHFDLKKVFNNVPFVDETITVDAGNVNVSNVDASGNFVNIWPKIEEDFKFAMDNLPETQGSEIGRANKWAAASYLAKVYMYQNKYAEAKALFDQIIANGKTSKGDKYALVNFFSNFNPAQDNSAESIFAYQASVNDGSGTNGNYGDNLNYPNGLGFGCCGFFNPSISQANAYKTDANGLPLFDDVSNTGNSVSAPTSPYVGNLDPRLDLTMGRDGIPFLDWGIPTFGEWIRDPASNGYFRPRKVVYAKGQPTFVSTETAFWGPTQMDAGNVNLIRYADVLLMAAEAEVEVGSTDKALQYVNMIRTRAADPTGWVYKNSDYDPATAKYKTQTTPADTYKIAVYPAGSFADKAFARKAIRFERRLELAEEGHRFFDLRRWDGGTGTMANTLNAYKTAELTRPSIYALNPTASFDKGKDEFYPLPQAQIDAANSTGTVVLKQNQ
jgi:starch-binding outer membrane protein, SusD/RagB family